MNRSFNCKDEELPVLCGFGAINLARDLSDFAAYSPLFDAHYLANFKAKIEILQELVHPKSETIELKVITEQTYVIMDDLITHINHLEGYLNLAMEQVPISSSDFGLVQLRKSARVRDVERALNLLQAVDSNVKKYEKELMAKGLTGELVAKFDAAAALLAEARNKRYMLVSSRAAIVQNNMGLLNDLSNQLAEICRIGKILYKQTDKAKLKDYTFTQMTKQVKRSDKSVGAKKRDRPVPAAV